PLNGNVSVTLPNVAPSAVIYIQVAGARSDAFGIGSYRLQVDSGSVSQSLIAALDVTLTNQNTTVHNDGHNTQNPATARALDTAEFATTPGFDYAINATLADPTAVNYFRVTTPATAPGALVFSVAATFDSELDPQLAVYDQAGNAVPAQVLSNDHGTYVIQVL